MGQQWDTGMRALVHLDPQAFVDLVLPGARFIRLHPTKMKGTQLDTDAVLEVELDGERLLIHLEFQTYNDKEMAHRLLRYYVLLWWHYDLKIPVRSYVIYLLRDGKVAISPLVVKVPGGSDGREDELLRFRYGSIEIGRMRPQQILAMQSPALLPFLPLTRGGAKLAMVETMFAELAQAGNLQFEVIGFLLATLAFQRYNQQHLEWLFTRYAYMHDILHDTPGFQWALARERLEGQQEGRLEGRQEGRLEGQQEGRLETLRQTIIAVTQARFPLLVSLAQQQVTTLTDPATLQNLLVQLSVASSTEEAQQLLHEPRPPFDQPAH